jgi:hypothetical protein
MVSSGSDEPATCLNQPDDRMQQPVGGSRDAQRFATPHDEAIQMIDLMLENPGNEPVTH